MNAEHSYAAMIAGTHSGSGKTTWTLALLELARRKGLIVQPFKAGPDYIDPGFHSAIAHPRISRNLDLFLLSEANVQKTFERHSAGAGLSLVEGMMGLFDGREIGGCSTSSAQAAKTLGLPVFLVVDGAGLAGSAAAIVLGFQQFDPDVRLAGVLFNRVSSASHFDWLRRAVEGRTGVPCLGYLPKDEELHIPERHLGLTTAAEFGGNMSGIRSAADRLELQFDWERFLKAAQPVRTHRAEQNSLPVSRGRPLRIGVARDRAFSFYYEDNFDILRSAGAELVFFSPLEDAHLPAGLDLLYFGGGFPEIYAPRLSQNQLMLEAVKTYYQSGGFIYAECGGLIYLAETFVGEDLRAVPLAGLIPGEIRMTKKLQHFGYHEMETACDSFLFPAGARVRSHEFHYSEWLPGLGQRVQPVYRIGEREEGFASSRLLASYQHLHFGSFPDLPARLIQQIGSARTAGARV